MKVYIEVVLLDNLLMTAAISLMSYYVAGVKAGKRRTAAASVIGTAVSIGYPFIPVAGWLLVFIKLAVGVFLAAILFFRKGKLLSGVIIFFLMTALSGGVCILVNYAIIGNFRLSLTSAPVLPYCVPAAVVCALTLTVKIVWTRTKKKRLRACYNYDVHITLLGRRFRLKGFLDSGNTLYDGGRPVIVIKLSALEKKLDDKILVLLLCGEGQKIDGVSYIDAFGLAGASRLAAVKVEKIELYSGKVMNTNNNVIAGISVNDFGGDADVLLHPDILGG